MDSKEIFVKWATICKDDSDEFKKDFMERLDNLNKVYYGVKCFTKDDLWNWFCDHYEKSPVFETAFLGILTESLTKYIDFTTKKIQELMNMGGIGDVYST